MDTPTLQWQEPPQRYAGPRGRAQEIDAQVAALRAKPGEWAVVERSTVPNRLGNAAAPYRQRGCEITVQDGALYVRWPAPPPTTSRRKAKR
jgi:hypothetical protein